jgi:hypothetical protein
LLNVWRYRVTVATWRNRFARNDWTALPTSLVRPRQDWGRADRCRGNGNLGDDADRCDAREHALVMGNASSHKTKLIRDWFAKRPRWHAHYYRPTSASWINQVERFFALLTDQQIRRGAH